MSNVRTASDWNRILVQCQVKPLTAAKWAAVFAAQIQPGTFSAGDSEIDDFLGQILHESGRLETLSESLNYSVAGLLSTFGRHRISEPDANRLGRIDHVRAADQVGIANTIYGGTWGATNLGNTQPGDGWKYRGSGLVQCTGRNNFAVAGKAIGVDLIANPDLLRTDPAIALRASIAWWERTIPDSVMGDIVRVTKLVNGGTIGLDDRIAMTNAAHKGLA
jgi:putative chitinase